MAEVERKRVIAVEREVASAYHWADSMLMLDRDAVKSLLPT